MEDPCPGGKGTPEEQNQIVIPVPHLNNPPSFFYAMNLFHSNDLVSNVIDLIVM